jgi:hypothetical protein
MDRYLVRLRQLWPKLGGLQHKAVLALVWLCVERRQHRHILARRMESSQAKQAFEKAFCRVTVP